MRVVPEVSLYFTLLPLFSFTEHVCADCFVYGQVIVTPSAAQKFTTPGVLLTLRLPGIVHGRSKATSIKANVQVSIVKVEQIVATCMFSR